MSNNTENYIKIYTGCWNNNELDNRPTINQVVVKLKSVISNFQQNEYNADVQLSSEQLLKPNNEVSKNNITNSLHEKMPQIIQNFNRMNIKEIGPSISSNLIRNDLELMIGEVILLFEDIETEMRKYKIVDYLNNHNITSQEIYNWLLINQDNSDCIFLLGVFNHIGIEVNVHRREAFELYQKAVNLGNIFGIISLGYCYEKAIGTSLDHKKAIELYQKAANLGSIRGMYNLANCYRDGIGTNMDEQKAFELIEKVANSGNTLGICNLGCFYYNGIGTYMNRQKAFELYQKAANSGNYFAQCNLAIMYECGVGIVKKDINQAIYWYKKSAEQGFQKAQDKLNMILIYLKEIENHESHEDVLII
ncbi:hypothetical protein RclHR1_06410010 [Rhizophagus clarus]|uniref:Kinase-like domain-containing protein n=1 Tax=Rhizophagus clarus TaxID=94130 RepID=A0A2Z6RXY3_9GLOM|nr:hypothetical protein RclHR1_06410010 [Rhizophagus clarus]GES87974.1 kinase-like domain-containing protein [Rhizophagus clarus]